MLDPVLEQLCWRILQPQNLSRRVIFHIVVLIIRWSEVGFRGYVHKRIGYFACFSKWRGGIADAEKETEDLVPEKFPEI